MALKMKPVAVFGFILLFHLAVNAAEHHPLAPPDTTSPRSTLAYFIGRMDRAYQINLINSYKSREARDNILKAARCLDLSHIAPADIQDTSFETALLLKEVLDRLEIPPADKIPDAEAIKSQNRSSWKIPNTRIIIAKVQEGPREGEYLFSKETVSRTKEFYNRVKHLPYRQGASVRAFEDFIYSPGPLVPNSLMRMLPDWATDTVFEQAVWQWICWAGLLIAGTLGTILVIRWTRSTVDTHQASGKRWAWREVIAPLASLMIARIAQHLIDEQVNITGHLLEITNSVLRIVLFAAACWFILLTGKGLGEIIINSPRFRPRSIDANLARLIFRVVTLVILIVMIWNVTDYLGISLTAVFASAGIAGVAFALAARETLANFFGGISILLDRPFKTGDYIIIESGERGEVLEVGFRSTWIVTRDDVQIAIPNSILTSSKVINESAPLPRFRVRIKVGVAYGTDIDRVERILLEEAKNNSLVSATPEPRVRFRAFGDSALDIELLCWANRPHDKGKLIHELNRRIYQKFDSEAIVIPFPQRQIHVTPNANEKKPSEPRHLDSILFKSRGNKP